MEEKKTLLFIFNPFSGKAQIKNQLMDIVDTMVKAGYEVTIYPTQAPEDAIHKVEVDAEKYDLVVRPYSPAATTMKRSVLFSRASCGLLPTGRQTAAPRRWRSRISRRAASWEKIAFPTVCSASAERRQSSLSCCASPEGG